MPHLDDLQGLTEISMFTGAGGGVLASRLLGWKTVQYVEWDPYCQEVLKARMADGSLHDAPVHGDVGTFDGTPFQGKVDIIVAGPPCQGFSVAGKQLADKDERNRWPDTIRVIQEVQPRYAFIENVPGLLGDHGYFGTILRDLTKSGYDAVWSCLPAAGVGAPHRRDRLWVLATRVTRDSPDPRAPLHPLARLEVGTRAWVTLSGNVQETPFGTTWPRAGILRTSAGESTCYVVRALADSKGTTPRGGMPWPDVLGDALLGYSWEESVEDDPSGDGELPASPTGRPWPTPNTLDGIVPRDTGTIEDWNNARDGRSGRKALANLRQAVVSPEYVGPESFPTPTVYDATGHGNARSEMKDGSRHAVSLHHLAADETWPTPKSVGGRNSRGALLNEEGRYHGRAGIGLEQAAELAEGIVPREYEGVDPASLPPAIQARWPTPMSGGNRTSTKAQTGRPTSGPSRGGPSLGLEDAVVKAETFPTPRAEDSEQTGAHRGVPDTLTSYTRVFPTPTAADAGGGPGNSGREGGDNLRTAVAKFPTPTGMDAAGFRGSMLEGRTSENHGRTLTGKVLEQEGQHWPTPRAASPGSRPNGNGGKVLAEEVEIAEGLRTRGELLQDPTSEAWPTPRAKDWKGADPAREENRSGLRHSGDDLSTAVAKRGGGGKGTPGKTEVFHFGFDVEDTPPPQKSWPTPMAGPINPQDGGGAGGVKLAEEATDNPEAPRGQLNPDWVELLMGWPRGWTTTEPLVPGEFERWHKGFSLRPHEGGLEGFPQYGPAAWAGGSWEESIPRIAVNIKARVSRLRAIGNGQVSLCAATAARALFEMQQQVETAFVEASKGPPVVDVLDFFVDGSFGR